ncbi:MAG: hypothetical protein AAFX79_05375 [Planctomycetota bacterium]
MLPYARNAATIPALTLVLGLCLALCGLSALGCASAGERPTGDALTDLQNPELRVPQRIEAIDQAWEDPSIFRGDIREALRGLVWAEQAPADLRLAALDKLMGDASPEGLAESRTFIRLRVPRVGNYEMVRRMGVLAVARGWRDLTPAFVRSYAQVDEVIPDEERIERDILEALNPEESLERIVIRVFLDPNQPPIAGEDVNDRVRAEAWDLLARLDPSGDARRDILAGEQLPADAEGTRVLGAMRRGLTELRVVPRTGDELRWLLSLADSGRSSNAAWWNEVATIVRRLDSDQAAGLRLRHLEVLRWASVYREPWLRQSRQEMLSRLAQRLAEREFTPRRADERELRDIPQEFVDARPALSWGDAVSLLALDVALHDPDVLADLFRQVALDRDDETTEYGGLVFAGDDGRFLVRLYPPRPQHRRGDDIFVASSDMVDQGDQAIAWYHFHATRERNSRFAGPSLEDFEQARSSGRLALVLTSVREGELNADAYAGEPFAVDLGEVVGPPSN